MHVPDYLNRIMGSFFSATYFMRSWQSPCLQNPCTYKQTSHNHTQVGTISHYLLVQLATDDARPRPSPPQSCSWVKPGKLLGRKVTALHWMLLPSLFHKRLVTEKLFLHKTCEGSVTLDTMTCHPFFYPFIVPLNLFFSYSFIFRQWNVLH